MRRLAPLCVIFGCHADGSDDEATEVSAPVGDVSQLSVLTYVSEIRDEDLVPGTRSVVDPHEGKRGWPRLILILDPGEDPSLAQMSYQNEGVPLQEQSWVDVGKYRYSMDALQLLDDDVIDLDTHAFSATMIFVGAQLRGLGTFSEDWSTLDLVIQYDLVDPGNVVTWSRLGRITMTYRDHVEDTG